MQAKLVSIGNSKGVRIPKKLIAQFGLDKGNIEITVRKEGILISALPEVAPLSQWDDLFKAAKQKGFDSRQDADEFNDWNLTLSDGIE